MKQITILPVIIVFSAGCAFGVERGTAVSDHAAGGFVRQLESEDYEIKKQSLNALNTAGQKVPLDDETAEALAALLDDPDWRIRARAVVVMRFVENKNIVIDRLIVSALSDESVPVKAGAIQTLGVIGDKKTLHPLSSLLDSEDENIRRAAGESIKKLEEL